MLILRGIHRQAYNFPPMFIDAGGGWHAASFSVARLRFRTHASAKGLWGYGKPSSGDAEERFGAAGALRTSSPLPAGPAEQRLRGRFSSATPPQAVGCYHSGRAARCPCRRRCGLGHYHRRSAVGDRRPAGPSAWQRCARRRCRSRRHRRWRSRRCSRHRCARRRHRRCRRS